jgi:type II secretory pathway component PulF
MATFTYKARDSKGVLVQGAIEAESIHQVTQRLQAMGYFPTSVVEDRNSVAAQRMRASKGRVKINDLATFMRQMADLLGAGVPLVKALSIIETQSASATMQGVVSQLAASVSSGDALYQAMSRHPKVFSKLQCAMVKAGEAGGLLDEVLLRLADFTETEADLRGKVKAALTYPMVMVATGIVSVVVLLTFVMPKIVGIYAELDQDLPLPTEILLLISSGLVDYWYIIVGVLSAGILGLYQAAISPDGRRLIDRIILTIPILGEVIRKREVANFSRTLGSLLHNGVSILPALEIVRDVLSNRIIADEVGAIPESVTQGSGIAGSLRNSKTFPPVVVNMIAVGEETGRLDDVLLKVARSYDTEVDRSLKTLTSLIEPLIILALGVVVGFIVIAMLLPIFSIDPGGGG